MRHRLFPLLAAALLAGAAACDGITEVQPDQPFKLKVGQTAAVPDSSLVLRFAAVTGDSRCPVDVVCVWAGDATVRLNVRESGDTSTVDVHTFSPRTARVGAWLIQLVELEPGNRAGHPIPQEDYVATLQVQRK